MACMMCDRQYRLYALTLIGFVAGTGYRLYAAFKDSGNIAVSFDSQANPNPNCSSNPNPKPHPGEMAMSFYFQLESLL